MTPRTKVDSSQYKIADADIEIKENQYLNDEAEYYKALKARPHKPSCEKMKSEFFNPRQHGFD
jgi:hypothetical protein